MVWMHNHVPSILLKVIVSLVIVLFTIEGKLFEIVNNEEKYYLISNGMARQILDEKTVTVFNFNVNELRNITSLSGMTIGKPILLIDDLSRSPDDIIRVEVAKSAVFHEQLINTFRYTYTGRYINPSVLPFKDRYILAAGLEWGFSGSANAEATGCIEFMWLNSTRYPFYTSEPYLGLNSEVSHFLNDIVKGQDPRMVIINSKKTLSSSSSSSQQQSVVRDKEDDYDEELHVFYTNSSNRPLTMGTAVIKLNSTTNNLEVVRKFHTIRPTERTHDSQKNWSPFVFNQKNNDTDKGNKTDHKRNEIVLLIEDINPLIVMTMKELPGQTDRIIHAFTFSEVPFIELDWKYGHLRGGK